ncbi:MAG TPA: hypothetical protein VIE68_01445 [Gemmatimonadota bacterium]|jgi:hypothetical protein
MHRIHRIALAAAALLLGCDNSPSTGVEGTYPLTLTYTVDECAGDQGRSEALEVTIERDGNDVTFDLGASGILTGTFNEELRTMTVDGTILVPVPPPGSGTFPGQMHMVARVTEGELNALGRITFDGTFPGVSGICERFFEASGERNDSLSVFSLTAP